MSLAVNKDDCVGLRVTQGVVYLHDMLHITTTTGRKIENALVTRIDEWSTFPVKVQYRAEDGVLRNEAVNLNACSWCHVGGQLGKELH